MIHRTTNKLIKIILFLLCSHRSRYNWTEIEMFHYCNFDNYHPCLSCLFHLCALMFARPESKNRVSYLQLFHSFTLVYCCSRVHRPMQFLKELYQTDEINLLLSSAWDVERFCISITSSQMHFQDHEDESSCSVIFLYSFKVYQDFVYTN